MIKYAYEKDAESNALNYTQLKITEVSNKVITLEPENTLFDARNTLLRYNISRIVIAKDNKALGILTEKDISRILYTEPVDKDEYRQRIMELNEQRKDLWEVVRKYEHQPFVQIAAHKELHALTKSIL